MSKEGMVFLSEFSGVPLWQDTSLGKRHLYCFFCLVFCTVCSPRSG